MWSQDDFPCPKIQLIDENSNHNATWQIKPFISTPLEVNISIYRTTLWITNDMNPNNKTGTEFEYNYSSTETINKTFSWSGANWEINFTDLKRLLDWEVVLCVNFVNHFLA
jgi:hypothetical protein